MIKDRSYFVYVGTCAAEGRADSIHICRFDPGSERLDPIGSQSGLVNPAFLAVHPSRRFLYTVSDVASDQADEGGVTSFRIDNDTGRLTVLNRVFSGGGGGCHLALDNTGRTLLVANYFSGSIAAFPVQEDGQLGNPATLTRHHGSSVNQKRQNSPHPHAVVVSPDNRFVLVPDLGLDQVISYRLDSSSASLIRSDPPFAGVEAGSGPRHIAFHPAGGSAYLISEMAASITALSYDQTRGTLRKIQTVLVSPEGNGASSGAEIDIDPAGRFLYASNRGDDSISVFAISSDGTLELTQRISAYGRGPRSIRLTPSGSYLLAANQNSDSVVLFWVDPKTGSLVMRDRMLRLQSPACIEFVIAWG
ncbi:MAG: lactonase family protein [Bryobacteraceae bacterium]